MVPAVFISCVSAEFAGYRSRLKADLENSRIKISIQDDFPEHDRDTLFKLDEIIREDCEDVIHLVGRGCGAPANDEAVSDFVNSAQIQEEPRFTTEIAPFADVSKIRLSYTHWEVQIARFRGKHIWVFEATPPILDGQKTGEDTFVPRVDDATRLAEHKRRLSQSRQTRFPIQFSSYEELKNAIVRKGILEYARRHAEGRIRTGVARPSLHVEVKNAIAPANLLMKWGLRRQGGVVFFSAPDGAPDTHPSLVALEQILSERAQSDVAGRIWGSISCTSMVEGAASEHVDAWTQHRVFEMRLLDRVLAGNTALGFIVQDFKDAAQTALQRVQAWRQSLVRANPQWNPLIFLLGREMPLADVLSNARVEAGGVISPVVASDTLIVVGEPDGANWKSLETQGVRRLCRLTSGGRTVAERAVFAPVLRWLNTQDPKPEPPKEESPFPASSAVAELETLAPTTAYELTLSLSRWLAQFHRHLAPAFVQAAASSRIAKVAVAALDGVNEHPDLVDAWMAGLDPDLRDLRLADGEPAIRAAALQISTAWARRILRGNEADFDAYARWAGTHLCAAVARVSLAVARRDPAALRAELEGAGSLDVYIWLAQVAPELDLVVDDMPSVVRGRGAFWRVVEALPATSVHLTRLLKLSCEDRAVLGLCSETDLRELANTPIAIQRIRRLQSEI